MHELHFVRETGSTNADLVARLRGAVHVREGEWLVADRQTSGRGRQGRSWIDAPGNFMGSTVVHLHASDPAPSSLSFVTALAVYEAIVTRLPDPALLTLKWPNDVLLGGAKFCGILLEREGAYAVIGIGVNLAAAPDLPDRRTRTLSELGPAPARDAFAADLASHFDREISRWREFGTDPIFARWQAAAHTKGTQLTVHEPSGGAVSGRFDGLEPDGALRLRLDNGTTRVIHAGDVNMENG